MNFLIELVFLIVLFIILVANFGVYKLYKKYKNIPNESLKSGFEIAQIISQKYCHTEPHIIKRKGKFLDHYKENRNVIKLSPEVFDGTDLYSAFVSAHLALETENKEQKTKAFNNYASFCVLFSYVMLMIGSFLKNTGIIHFGLVLFIFSFLLIIIASELYGRKEENLSEIYKFIEENELIKPSDDDIKNIFIILAIMPLAKLPYGFINYFK